MSASTSGVGSTVRVAPGRVLAIACFGAFLAFLDATIVNVAFPSIRESFVGASIGSLSWILNAYNIVFAAFLIVFGRFTDLVGRRRVFLVGLGVFTAASVACGLAPTVQVLVAFRIAQAAGAALLVPASLALVIAAFPAERRAHGIGIWGAAGAIAAGLGPPTGGLLVELGGWRWAFLVNLPFGLLAIAFSRRHLTESRAPGRRVLPDLAGAGLLAAAMTAVNLAVIQGSDWGWTSLPVLGCFVATVVLGLLFIRSSARHRSPMLDPTLLQLRSFVVGNLATIAAGFGFYAYLLTNILWLQYVWRYTVLEAGLALVPGALVAAVVAARLGPIAAARGYRWFIVPGALVWASAYLWYHERVGLEPRFWGEWMPGQVLSGLGVGLTLPLLASAALASVPGGRYATASAIVSSSRQLGGVLGIAILVVLLGEPTPANAVTVFRHGWVLSIIAFVVVAVIATALPRKEIPIEEVTDDVSGSVVLAPAPPASWSPPRPGELDAPMSALLGLPAQARTRLAAAARPLHVVGGSKLIRQGDPAGDAYAVLTGRLDVEVDGLPIREVGAGDVIGELALVTGESRSATVRARRDSAVLAIPRDAFDELMRTDPGASRAVLAQLAHRLQTVGPAARGRVPQRPTVISMVGLSPRVPVDDVGRVLADGLREHLRVAVPGRVDAAGLEQAERQADRVVLVAGAHDELSWQHFCVRQADTVVFVAHADDAERLDDDLPRPARRPELVLVGRAGGPARHTRWVEATDAWAQTTVDPAALATGLRPLVARLAGRALGLVLGGGGARGLAHVGVIQELEAAGFHIDRISGTSMGAIVAAPYATGMDGVELADAMYENCVRRPFTDWHPSVRSLARGTRLARAFSARLGADTVIEGLPRQLRVVSVDLVSRTRQVHERGLLAEAAMASARLPVLFPAMPRDDGRLLVDGGILDNLPVSTLVERDEGPVVAVAIGGGGSERRRSGPPRIPTIGEALMRTLMISSGGAIEGARTHGAWVISPPTMGVGLLEFHQLDTMIRAGRAAARALLEVTGGDLGLLGQQVLPGATDDGIPTPGQPSGSVVGGMVEGAVGGAVGGAAGGAVGGLVAPTSSRPGAGAP